MTIKYFTIASSNGILIVFCIGQQLTCLATSTLHTCCIHKEARQMGSSFPFSSQALFSFFSLQNDSYKLIQILLMELFWLQLLAPGVIFRIRLSGL